jgi:hypothetical protein
MSDVEIIRNILRTFADVRNGPFYSLYVNLMNHAKNPVPSIDFRIYPVAESTQAYLVVAVTGTRPDGVEVCWSISLETEQISLVITAAIEVSEDHGWREVFRRSAHTLDSQEASTLIRSLGREVCAELRWFEE